MNGEVQVSCVYCLLPCPLVAYVKHLRRHHHVAWKEITCIIEGLLGRETEL